MRKSILTLAALVLMLLVSLGTSAAAERPILGSAAKEFISYFGEAKSLETALGITRLWRKESFMITHIEGNRELGFDCLSVEKVENTSSLNRREAFLIAEMFCGKQEWEFRKDENGTELYVSGDKTYQLAFSGLASESMRAHITLTCFRLSTGIKDL